MESKLFSPISIGDLAIKNRIVVAPMCQYSAIDGSATDWHLMHLGQFSVSGSGLVFIEATAVEEKGRITPGCLGLYSDNNEKKLEKIVQFFKKYGSSKIGIQLAHAGRKASTEIPWRGGLPLEEGNDQRWETVAPSAESYSSNWPSPSKLETSSLREILGSFVAAANRSVKIGFDVIELHMAHGYLLHQFLSPVSNTRTDEYGQTLEGRMKFPLEVFRAVRNTIPENFPLGVRFSATDWIEDSTWDLTEAIIFGQELKKLGCKFIDVSSGGNSPRQKILSGPAYQASFAAEIKKQVEITTIAVGQINEPLQAESIIGTGQADMVAIGRGMLYNPRWAWHAADVLSSKCAFPPQYARAHRSLIGLPIPGNPQK